MDTTLLQALERLDTIPMHMPGHKRNVALAPYLKTLGADLDITEITDYDCLHHPQGILAQTMDKAAALWHAEHSFLLVNGSTCGLLSAIHATTRPGDLLLMARGCHKAVYNAVAICGLQVAYLPQSQDPSGYYLAMDAQTVLDGLSAHPTAKVVVLTSPTYEGYVTDIAPIAQACHRQGAVLVVDEAHGAHLGLSPLFPPSALSGGADIVVQSLHKTLPSLTQTAIAHVQGDLVNRGQFARSLGVFQTSSPSYLLLASIDGCIDLLQSRGEALFAHWHGLLVDFYDKTTKLRHLSVVDGSLEMKDPSKVVISTAGANIDAVTLKHRLYTDHQIELELAYGDYALAMTGMGDVAEHLDALAVAMSCIDGDLSPAERAKPVHVLPQIPLQRLTAQALHNQPWVGMTPEDGVGRICADYLWAYPPGVPLIVPGEVISGDLIGLICQLEGAGVDIHDTLGVWPTKIACKA